MAKSIHYTTWQENTDPETGLVSWSSPECSYTVRRSGKIAAYYAFRLVDAKGRIVAGPNGKYFRYLGDAMRAGQALENGSLHIAYMIGSWQFVHDHPAVFRRQNHWSSERCWRIISNQSQPIIRATKKHKPQPVRTPA